MGGYQRAEMPTGGIKLLSPVWDQLSVWDSCAPGLGFT